MLALHVGDERLVHLIAAHADRLPDNHPSQRDDGDLRGATANVTDHARLRLGDREPGADRRGHRLLDQVRGASAGRHRRFLDRAPLDVGDSARHAHDRTGAAAAADRSTDEVMEHALRQVEVGDDAVTERAQRPDRRRRSPDHPLRLLADGMHLARSLVDSDH
jgi:hypothetical protein